MNLSNNNIQNDLANGYLVLLKRYQTLIKQHIRDNINPWQEE